MEGNGYKDTYGATQMEEKRRFNDQILNDEYDGKKDGSVHIFTLKINNNTIEDYKTAITFRNNENHKYLKKICDNRPDIIVYHKAGISKLKNCSDIDHFHMITWRTRLQSTAFLR